MARTNSSPIGINGLHISHTKEILYFTNSAQSLFASIPINPNATLRGAAGIITNATTITPGFDDFALDLDDNAYIATSRGNTIAEVAYNGRQEVLAGSLNSTEIAQPTSARFGRGRDGKRVLYVTTAGGLAAPVDVDGKEVVVGGQVVAVEVGG